jgi:hypothetical protein
MVSPLTFPHYVFSALEKHGHDSLHAEGWIGEKAYLVIIDTGAPSTIACLADGISIEPPHLGEAFIKLTLGRRPVTTQVFVANITDEFILGLHVTHGFEAARAMTGQ